MLPLRIALTSRSDEVSTAHLQHVAAALQTQVIRDVAPIWSVTATVSAFEWGHLPVGFWPLVIVDKIEGPHEVDIHGVHVMKDGLPMGLVQYSPSWSLTASHELIEMIVDPVGKWTLPGRSWEEGQGQVDYLVEACDPCQDASFAYPIDGVLVSDFVTPHFYGPFEIAGARYSLGGNVEGPRRILRRGYLSWRDPRSGEIWQRKWEGGNEPVNTKLGTGDFTAVLSMRAWIDTRTPNHELVDGLDPSAEPLRSAARWFHEANDGARARAEALGRQLDELYDGEAGT
jgi:hypothetical protein